MTYIRPQSTIAAPVSVSGFGFWNGKNVTVEFHPAPADSGLVFVRTDLPQPAEIIAVLANRIPGPRRTTLSCRGVQVEMVEHLLAALAGLQIDNCEIRIDGPEVPGLDGSSAPFVEALLRTETVLQAEPRRTLEVFEPVRIESGESWIEARPHRDSAFRINYLLDYPQSRAIGSQKFSIDLNPAAFVSELASARTFLLESEARLLLEKGLGHRVSFSDVLVFGDDGPIDNQLRFPDECARHKALDIVGDFALAGCDWIGEITASRTGHQLNAELIHAIEQQNQIGIRQSA